MDANIALLILFILILIIIPAEKYQQGHIMRKRKGVKRKMPAQLLNSFLNKECVIYLFGGHVVQGTIVEVEENWIKVNEKKKVRLLNGDMIADISTKTA